MKYQLLQTIKKAYGHSPKALRQVADTIRYKWLIKNAFDTFLSAKERKDSSLCKALKIDIMNCHKSYLTSPQEYFLYGFRDNMNVQYRESFLSDEIRNRVLRKLIGSDVFQRELRDKFSFYKLTSKYFKRGVFLFPKGGCPFDDFRDFTLQYKELFLKRNSSSKGRGVMIATVENELMARSLYEELLGEGGDWIIEERIKQSSEMAQWNDSSVNTIRIPSILNDDVFTVIGPVFRTGRKGSIIDNAAAGGIISCIDADTGIIISDGVDETQKYYERHPDSGIIFKGWQIPQWKELLTIVNEIQRTIPHHKYVGWDFSLTDRGWVLIEGNWGQFLSQYNNHIGLKNQFLSLLGYDGEY